MKKLILFSILLFITFRSMSQGYVPFPTGTATWNTLYYSNGNPDPNDNYAQNFTFTMNGDTVIGGTSFNKIYCDNMYIGGLREDASRNIYFAPYNTNITALNYLNTFFPGNAEYIIYSFDSLYVGQTLNINSGANSIQVVGIDTVTINGQPRKRYEISNQNMIFGNEYWIEGIGSTKHLLSSYAQEFEWKYYTLCYTDNNGTVPLNSPDGNDSCHYTLSTGISELADAGFNVYPNPAKDKLTIETKQNARLELYTIQGALLRSQELNGLSTEINISELNKGVYVLKLISAKGITTSKLIRD